MFKKDEYVIVEHPDCPELNGVVKVIDEVVSSIIRIEFCDDKSKWMVHKEYIRHATQDEINGRYD
ncbi:hypothetical protein [Peribacillus loiseleuriae]|uniref:Uncharacterized protein n=1 Tax=Peribacillus loiseleuriae TaxID=1679170 RepID=A0A0K9GSF9_9BACI|nr:hypothetical protein [Peribacillus loiseleuriae]KMY49217.1 hypothetical protein AC625_06510 [Peribacillus loiseleuriae]